MMKKAVRVVMPSDRDREALPYYLAAEEWLAANIDIGRELLFAWRVSPTVIYGRNQDPTVEIDLDYCREHNIATYRRRSGGGCVYADEGNIMFSLITADNSRDVPTAFSEYSEMMVEMLRSFGLDADVSGRNDITVEGRKVSGAAFSRLPSRSIIHGTMLYSVNADNLRGALTPSRAKLESKKVKSVESRVTTLSRHLPPEVTIEDFLAGALDRLTDEQYLLTPAQADEIEVLSQPYYDPEWLWHAHHKTSEADAEQTITRTYRFEGVGTIIAKYKETEGKLHLVSLEGDYFPLLSDPLNALLEGRLRPDEIINGLTAAHLRQILDASL